MIEAMSRRIGFIGLVVPHIEIKETGLINLFVKEQFVKRLPLLLSVLVGLMVLVACVTSAAAPQAAGNEAVAESAAVTGSYPLTIENCGNTLTFTKAPERVVSLYSVTTELLLRLGLEDHIVAAANFGEPMPADLQPVYEQLNLVGENFVIPREVLLT